MATIIPIELIERVLDFLYDALKALYSCALTHPSWYPHAHFLLYSRVEIRDRKSYDIIRLRGSQEASFRSLFEHTTELVLVNDPESQYTHETPSTIGGLFPALRSITFIHSLRWLTPDWMRAPIGFASVERLVLRCCDFRTFTDLQHTITAFRGLRDLRLHFPMCSREHKEIPNASPALPRNKLLRLNRFHLVDFTGTDRDVTLLLLLLDWIAFTPCVLEGTVTALVVLPAPTWVPDLLGDERVANALQTLYHQLGPSLIELELPGPRCRNARGGYRADLSKQIRLRYLSVSVPWYAEAEDLSSILDTVASRCIRRLSIVVEINVEDNSRTEFYCSAVFPWLFPLSAEQADGGCLTHLAILSVTFVWTLPSKAADRFRMEVSTGIDRSISELARTISKLALAGGCGMIYFHHTFQTYRELARSCRWPSKFLKVVPGDLDSGIRYEWSHEKAYLTRKHGLRDDVVSNYDFHG